MSHGPAGAGSTIEPNLTPLLDVVLQLLMFFMMTVNFVNEQVTGEVKLPTSQSAVPLSKNETEVLFINIKIFNSKDYRYDAEEKTKKVNPDFLDMLTKKFAEKEPCVLVIGEETPMKLVELKQWLRTKYKDRQRVLGDDKVTTTIIIRADENLEYAPFYQILTFCKEAGFKHLKVRAKTRVGGDT